MRTYARTVGEISSALCPWESSRSLQLGKQCFGDNKRAGPLFTLYIVCTNNCSFYLGKTEEPFLQRISFVPFIVHCLSRSVVSIASTILLVNGHHQTSRASRKPAKTMVVATRRFQARFQEVNEPNRPETVFSIQYAELSKSKQQNENSLSVIYVKNFLASLCKQEFWVSWNSFLQQLAMVVTIRIGVSYANHVDLVGCEEKHLARRHFKLPVYSLAISSSSCTFDSESNRDSRVCVTYLLSTCFSEVAKVFGPIFGTTIPFIFSQRRPSWPSNFAVLFVFLTLKKR